MKRVFLTNKEKSIIIDAFYSNDNNTVTNLSNITGFTKSQVNAVLNKHLKYKYENKT